MGNPRGLGLHFIFVCAFLFAGATFTTCLGDGNMSVICSEQERLALFKFKQSVKDFSGMLSSWVGNDCCLWEGVHCEDTTVESLNLRGCWRYKESEDDCYLSGDEVNPCLAELSHLKSLDLSGNDFEGSQIPKFFRSLKQLTYLNLSHAGFEGIISPYIGNLSNLKVLDLSSNGGLKADDMAWTSGLSSLEYLDLSEVDLGRAKNRDMVFYMIPSLEVLSLSWCSLSNADFGPFLNSSRILPNIKHLDLSENSFQGPLPNFFQNLSSLTFLDLSYFDLSLAWNFANLLSMIPSLSELHLSGCGLDKTHLSSPHFNFSRLSNIQHLVLRENSIEGVFPPVFTNMSSLRVLDLSGNLLNLSVPVMPNLLDLDLSDNRFKQIRDVGIWRHCQIPESLGRLRYLEVLDLSDNKLTGQIPSFLGNLSKLDLSSNQLNGTIPAAIGKLAKLHSLDFSNNSLQGVVFEAHFADLSMLKYLDASFNTKLTFNVSSDWMPPFQLVTLRLRSCNITNGFPQ
ncbi:receptor-like protein EIX2 [Lactuca sativa]|uniref:receptor-like protein EIX2 n=1 Tax=Lactuca sativa TaxID=4236 RepID=UPI000CD870E7|nr:receptor-like protein EIX2 [Lactuca sativa]